MATQPDHPFVGRGGLKLQHAIETFSLDVRGMTCADFGCNVGGFTDCLLRAGAAKVYAVDTGYGALAWTLRNDPRVVVMERSNALHAEPPRDPEGRAALMDLIAIDLAWTPQRHAVPAALRWLKPDGRIVSLVKPHYELSKEDGARPPRGGVLEESQAVRVVERIAGEFPSLGVRLLGLTKSPIAGGAGKGKRGNAEWLALLEPANP